MESCLNGTHTKYSDIYLHVNVMTKKKGWTIKMQTTVYKT